MRRAVGMLSRFLVDLPDVTQPFIELSLFHSLLPWIHCVLYIPNTVRIVVILAYSADRLHVSSNTGTGGQGSLVELAEKKFGYGNYISM